MNLDRFMELEKQRREIIAETENLKSQKMLFQKNSEMKKNKENADAVILEMRQVGEKISQLDKQLREVQDELHDILLVSKYTMNYK